MTASVKQFRVTAEDISGANRNREQGNYSDVACPGDHIAKVVSADDHIKRGETEASSTVFELEIATPSGPVPFKYWVTWSPKARFRITDFQQAFGDVLEPGVLTFEPDKYVGLECGVSVNWQKDRDTGEASNYREITEVFALVDEPIVEGSPTLPLEEPEVL